MKALFSSVPVLLLTLFLVLPCRAQDKQITVTIETSLGTLKGVLYDDTPLHRDQFVRLARAGHYDGTLFYRVIPGYMIQGGSSDTKDAQPGQRVGYSREIAIDPEFRKERYHKKGALSAPRQPDESNPRKRSDISQFFVVQGRIYSPEEIRSIEAKVNNPIKRSIQNKYLTPAVNATLDSLKELKKVAEFRAIADPIKEKIAEELALHPRALHLPEALKQDYTTIGGAYNLDQEYTVFGEITEGLEVIDKIAAFKRDEYDRPLTDVRIIRVTVQ